MRPLITKWWAYSVFAYLCTVTGSLTSGCIDLMFSLILFTIQSRIIHRLPQIQEKNRTQALVPAVLFLSFVYFTLISNPQHGRPHSTLLSVLTILFCSTTSFLFSFSLHLPAPPSPRPHPSTHTFCFSKCKDKNTAINKNTCRASFVFCVGHSF